MKRGLVAVMALLILAAVGGLAQTDPDVQKLLDAYQQAWNKGDAKALAALYTDDALRIGADGQPFAGRDAIEKSFTKNFAGPWKGTKLILRAGRTATVSQDVRIVEGTFELSGTTSGPNKGRFLNTLVRQAGGWRVAGLAAIPESGPSR